MRICSVNSESDKYVCRKAPIKENVFFSKFFLKNWIHLWMYSSLRILIQCCVYFFFFFLLFFHTTFNIGCEHIVGKLQNELWANIFLEFWQKSRVSNMKKCRILFYRFENTEINTWKGGRWWKKKVVFIANFSIAFYQNHSNVYRQYRFLLFA